ncbi:uncharacterized protein LACBIDRAFT_332950 [Laccaria bicolor S238N-H82]|uniref:Predicted protein n=1 Tax=Laccaria bicolor (strain S238N-H82 / ATCC MYA-4686) TaxID=486041 RepID=B0DUD7_LACBS|nr:uncharacterized protein LACBIDRAFT_332950 [Laccaria bicolor S238N-H82]EDR01785.1 predicted protein [Laccaria bicolor S238N-H82]|eukprot:XP_001887598.1 predicted protein [Laccaria bicolor S238N-H82]
MPHKDTPNPSQPSTPNPPNRREARRAPNGQLDKPDHRPHPARPPPSWRTRSEGALDAERATTPTPQSYNDVDMTMGDQNDPNRRVPWDEDIESSGDENDQRGIDQESIQADRFSHLADRSMSRDEKLDHLYNSLLDAGFFVQALESGGEMDIARTDQKITGCMTGLSNALLNQPYRVIMEQQAGLAKAIHEISKNMTTTMENMATIMENVQNNGEKIEHMKNETANSLTATSDRLKALESLATDTQSRIANLENREKTTNCECGVDPQTREHIIRDCERYEDQRAKLRDHDRELALPELLGTPKGITALSIFIRDSGAFTFTGEKHMPKETPSFQDEPEPPDEDSEDDESDAEP